MKYLFLILTILLVSCTNNSQPKPENNSEIKSESKNIAQNLSLQQKVKQVKESMLEYMKTGQPLYTKSNVDKCAEILETYLYEISNSKNKEEGMEIVKSTIFKLNDLNNNAKSELIETYEREQIANIIISASSKKGYNSMDEDITEKWREW